MPSLNSSSKTHVNTSVFLVRAGGGVVKEWPISDTAFAAASSWAAKSGDMQLTAQLTVLFNIQSLVTHIATVEKLARAARKPNATFAEKKISAHAVSALKSLRTATGSPILL